MDLQQPYIKTNNIFHLYHYYYNDIEYLQLQLEVQTKKYYAAIKRGEVFEEVKRIYLAMKKTKIELEKKSEQPG